MELFLSHFSVILKLICKDDIKTKQKNKYGNSFALFQSQTTDHKTWNEKACYELYSIYT